MRLMISAPEPRIIWNRHRRFNCVIGRHGLLCLALVLVLVRGDLAAGEALDSARAQPGPALMAYYASWSARADADTAIDEKLSQLAPEIGIVALAFAKPDMAFPATSLSNSGLETPYEANVLIRSLQKLRGRNPRTKILVSIGGATYANWETLNSKAIAQFVETLGLDGVDIDFEPHSPNCRAVDARIVCDSDELLRRVVATLRADLPRSAVLSLAVANVGAYGEGAWRNSKPVGSETYGLNLAVLRDPTLAAQIDVVTVMAYDAGADYRPNEAIAAVRSYFRGPILVGFTPPPEAWGGHSYSTGEVASVLRRGLADGASGAMLFSIGKASRPNPTPASPDASMMLETICSIIRERQTDSAANPRRK
jgi:chitinase